MTVLSIDTCEGSCSAALVRAGVAVAVRQEAIGRGHAERLLPMLDEMMAESGLGYDAVDRIAVTIGPGTFTGLRIGLSVARGLGLALDAPVVGVTSLQALAAGGEGTVHAVVMGRGGQGYHQCFRVAPGMVPEVRSEAGCFDGPDIETRVAATPGQVVGSGAALAGMACAGDAVDPVVLALLGAQLDAASNPPEPAYLRDADAAKAKALLPVE